MTKSTNTQATAKTNPFLAIFAEQTAKIEADAQKAINKQLTKLQEDNRLLVEAACTQKGVAISAESQEFYSLLVASCSTESIAAASGAHLAEKVVSMVGAYYAGNDLALQPIVDASNIWIEAKCSGEVKTANIPNNLRLLVSRKSVEIASDEAAPHDYKLVLSVEKGDAGKSIIVKRAPLKAKAEKTAAQKVFDALTKLDTMARDELIALISTDAAMVVQFAVVVSMNTGKIEAITKEGLKELENRKHAASEKEDILQESLDQATESKLQLADELGDAQDLLAENEIALTAKREQLDALNGKFKRARNDDTRKQLSEELLIVNAQLEDLLAVNAELTANVQNVQKRLDKAQDRMSKVSREYDAQAQLVTELAKQAEKVRAQLAH